jgi:hypothetical protein
VSAVWNLNLPEETGTAKTITLSFQGAAAAHSALISRVDSTHGSPLSAYSAMGSPANPTAKQIADLRRAAELPAPKRESIANGRLTIALPPQSLALIETQ